MMRRKYVAILLMLVLCIVSSESVAEFKFRGGIKWGMTKAKVLEWIEKEDGYESYEIDEYDNSIFYSLYPKEKDTPICWIFSVNNLVLGEETENVQLFFAGTTKTGLYDAVYSITPIDTSDDGFLACAKDLLRQLEKKYGSFDTEDHWNRRKNANIGDMLYSFWKNLDDGTYVYGFIEWQEEGYRFTLEYQSPDCQEIEKSLIDGSLYITPAFGL